MISAELWNWTSPVWLIVAMLVSGYLKVARGFRQGQLAILLIGTVLLTMAFVSPVGVLSDGYLFSAHMVQHLLLLLAVPACLLISLPKERAAEWFDRPWRNRLGWWLAHPAIGWTCGVGAMWFWHVPVLCSTATQWPALGMLRDVSLVLSGLAFWWPIYAPLDHYRLPPLSGIAYLFSACLGCTLLGIYITFSPISVCPVFANPVDRIGILNTLYNLGLTPGVDQHLGGLLMWVPPCIVYLMGIINLLCRWYSTTDDRSQLLSPLPHHLGQRHGPS